MITIKDENGSSDDVAAERARLLMDPAQWTLFDRAVKVGIATNGALYFIMSDGSIEDTHRLEAWDPQPAASSRS